MKQTFRIILGFLFILLWTIKLHAEVNINITQGVNIERPIAILPFHYDSLNSQSENIKAISENIEAIIAADLRNSGKFNPLNPTILPQQHISNVHELKLKNWNGLGINYIVIGKVTPKADGNYRVAYQLVDISNLLNDIVIENSFNVTKKWLRYAAHACSDEIFEKLTGIKGAFRTRIAYIVKRDNSNNKLPYELHVADYDGHNPFIIHRSPQPLMSPTWSPDGSQVAYVTFENGRSNLIIQTLSNGIVHHIASYPKHNGAPAFSPDGSKLAFALSKTGSLNLYVMNLSSGQISQITNDRYNNTEPSWFPDSKTLAYTSDQSGTPQIYKIDINEGIPQRLTWEGDKNQNAVISLDGKIMIMISSKGGFQHVTKQNLETGDVYKLTNTFLDETPSISPNGTMVIYSCILDMNSVIQLVSIDGNFKSCFPTIKGQMKFPAWSPYL